MIRRRRFHRAAFALAGFYNIVWGLWAVADPQWLFRFTGMPLSNHPALFACLGMMVGLYGILYFEIARVPERGWLMAAVGLTGKVLGPIGMLWLIWTGAWPAFRGDGGHSERPAAPHRDAAPAECNRTSETRH